ncbi:hypothetical protein [Sphingobacterium sp. 1.A.5]|uniref:hypothetical protein n=1 Tax=Sphingobacterium sp. 1.A.5 TaxID=2044604 RepID=UPI000C0C0A93|nr:hypothetical protein [Sphingobacterium sp. 1.A.5]
MPRLLKNDTIRLIEASIETLGLAQFGICVFRRDQLKIEQVRYSAEVGLIGSSIELMMSSILIQALGKKSIYKDFKTGRYKTAAEILYDFRNLLKQSSSNILFLLNGISDPKTHNANLLNLTNRFQLIITSRANGLHNGYGLKYEIVASLFQDVTEFYNLLAQSDNIRPYLTKVPELVGIRIDKNILIDDLYNKLNEATNIQDQKSLITSLFLILPEIPKNLPDWLDKFESIKISPKKNDIVYLIDALEKANPVALNKVTDTSSQLNVKIVGRDVEGAIPITAHFLKSEFTQIKDQFYADIATANGRLNSKQLDLPPKSSIYTAFAVGFIELNILQPKSKFTAHQSWPFIVASLDVSKNNTTPPFWFLIRYTDDLGQLKSCLKKASKLGNESLKNNINNVIKGIEAIEKDEFLDSNSIFIQQILSEQELIVENWDKLQSIYEKNGLNGLSEDYNTDLTDLFNEELPISIVIDKILKDDNLEVKTKKYWIAKLSSLYVENDDMPVLVNILDNAEYSSAHTSIRKFFRAKDFANYGPKVKSS